MFKSSSCCFCKLCRNLVSKQCFVVNDLWKGISIKNGKKFEHFFHKRCSKKHSSCIFYEFAVAKLKSFKSHGSIRKPLLFEHMIRGVAFKAEKDHASIFTPFCCCPFSTVLARHLDYKYSFTTTNTQSTFCVCHRRKVQECYWWLSPVMRWHNFYFSQLFQTPMCTRYSNWLDIS